GGLLRRFFNGRRFVRVFGCGRFVRFGLREQRAGCQQSNDQGIERLKHPTRKDETPSLSNSFMLTSCSCSILSFPISVWEATCPGNSVALWPRNGALQTADIPRRRFVNRRSLPATAVG